MNKIMLGLILGIFTISGVAYATDYNIAVTAEGDWQQKHAHWAGGGMNWSENNANNDVAYSYNCCPADVYWSNTYMNLSLPTFAAGETIDKATFNFNLLSYYNGNSGAGNLYHGNDFLLNISSQAIGWVSTDVTTFLQADQNNNIVNLQFSMLNAGAPPSGSGLSFSSGADSTYAPYLRLQTVGGPTVTPEPVSMALFGLGAGVLVSVRRRKKLAR